jgi:hypothetical protein
MRLLKLMVVLIPLSIAPAVAAQTDCPTIVRAALDSAAQACDSLARNQACYGNIHLQATPQEGKTVVFEKSGDIANVADLHTLQLSSMSLTDQSWGVALMKLQANLPDTIPGQNVTVLLFGNVEIDSAFDTPHELTMTARGGVNVRLRPTTQASSVIASLKPGQAVVANGRVKDGAWVRVKLDMGVGWVAANLLDTDGDVTALPVAEAGAAVYGPMQAFTFKSGFGDRPCEAAPDSGILIQTPKNAARVKLQVNGAQIDLGSTVYLQAQPGNTMTVTVLEGAARLTANGATQTVPARTYSEVPLNASGQASGKPAYPKPYNRAPLLALPVDRLPDPIDILLPLPTEQVDSAVQAAENSSLPPSGTWRQKYVVTVSTNCPKPESEPVGTTTNYPITFKFSEDHQTLVYDNGWQGLVTLARVGDNVYRGTLGSAITFTITFTSPTTFNITGVGIFGDPNNGGCVHIYEGSGVFLR